MAIAFLIIRLILGLAIAAHGTQKLFGWFGGPGLAAAGGFFESLGFRPGRFFAFAAAAGEIAAGVLTVFGLGGALGPVLVVMLMIVALGSVHVRNGFFQQANGWELNAFYVATALAVAFAGNGPLSLDGLFGISILTNQVHVWIALGVALVVATLNLAARRPATQQNAAA